jgi:hypothetical protein
VTPSFQNCKLSELRKEIKRGCSMHPMRENTTAAKLAKRLGVNIKTVYKYTALPRTDYLAGNTINRSKPWEAMSMSRATWYRKGKPVPKPGRGA